MFYDALSSIEECEDLSIQSGSGNMESGIEPSSGDNELQDRRVITPADTRDLEFEDVTPDNFPNIYGHYEREVSQEAPNRQQQITSSVFGLLMAVNTTGISIATQLNSICKMPEGQESTLSENNTLAVTVGSAVAGGVALLAAGAGIYAWRRSAANKTRVERLGQVRQYEVSEKAYPPRNAWGESSEETELQPLRTGDRVLHLGEQGSLLEETSSDSLPGVVPNSQPDRAPKQRVTTPILGSAIGSSRV